MINTTKIYLLVIFLISPTLNFGLGIDWGTEYTKSSLIIPGKGFEMVENTLSKRKTPNYISLCKKDRVFED